MMKTVILIFCFALGLSVGCGDDPLATALPEAQGDDQSSFEQEPTESDAVDVGQVQGGEKTDDPAALIRNAQHLVLEGKMDRGYSAAKTAVKQFSDAGIPLPSFPLERLQVGERRVDVQVNMGPRERVMPENGIVRPLSFHVFSEDDQLIDVFDFEIGRFNGESSTAAIGKTDGTTHLNFGIIRVDSSYRAIRAAALRVINPDGLPVRSLPIGKQAEKKRPALKLKSFLNLEAPKTSLLAPRVFNTEEGLVVIGLYWHLGQRDVAAFRKEEQGWQPLGKQGDAITGVGGNFLPGVVQDGKNRFWVLASYSRPSNPQRADRTFLYCLEDGRWTLKGPPQGHLDNRSGNDALVIFDDRMPAHFHTVYHREKKRDEPRLVYLKDDQWVPAPAADLLSKHAGVAFTAATIEVLKYEASSGTYRVHVIDSPTMTELPNAVDTFQTNQRLGKFTRSPSGDLAARVWTGDVPQLFVRTRIDGKLTNRLLTLPDDNSVDDMQWSSSGTLFIVSTDLENVRAFGLQGDQWKAVGQAKESSATVFDLHLFLGREDQPIATWEEFYAL